MVEVTKYNNKRETSIANLVKNMWMYRYPRTMKSCMAKEKSLLVTCSEIPNIYTIGDNFHNKHFCKYHFQFNIGTDSPGSRKPSLDL